MKNKKLQPYILANSFLFLGSILYGSIFSIKFPDKSLQIITDFSQSFGFIENLNSFLVFGFIFLNNALKTFLAILLGFFFGLFPLFFIIGNGLLLGIVLTTIGKEAGAKIILGILPHGIFEIPATILASSYGVWLGVKFYKKLKYKKSFKKYFKITLKKYFKIILPLLFIASLIETFLTPLIIKFIGL